MKSLYDPKETGKQIPEERVKRLNNWAIRDKRYVLYWMQSSQRVEQNLALEYAILKANNLNKPLVVFFGLSPAFPEANWRHYSFMLEGLQEVNDSLQNIGVKRIIDGRSPEKGTVELSKDACLTVVDKGYLRILREWYGFVAENVECPLIQVEDNVVVPVEAASGKEEYSARTIRAKIVNKNPMSLIETILTRRSIRRYQEREIPEKIFAQILEAGRQAPSAVNKQPIHFIIIKKKETKKAIATQLFNRFIQNAPIVIVGCADETSLLTGKWAKIDAAIAMQNMVIASWAHGIGSCWIGAFDEKKVKENLKIPDKWKVVALLTLGYPDEKPKQPKKKPIEELFSFEEF